MDRKQFLKKIYFSFIQPVLIVLFLIVTLSILWDVLTSSTTWRIFVPFLFIVFMLWSILKIMMTKVNSRPRIKMSEKANQRLNSVLMILNWVMPFALVGLIFLNWADRKEDIILGIVIYVLQYGVDCFYNKVGCKIKIYSQ